MSRKRTKTKAAPVSRVTAVDPVKKTITVTTESAPAAEQTKHAGGRPTKLDESIQERIVQAIRAGAYVETAAAFAGIAKDTFYAWLKQGRKDEEKGIVTPHSEFSDAIEKAMAEAELGDVMVIGKAAKGTEQTPGQWQAAAWRLERKHPERYGRRIVQIPDGGGDGKAKREPQYFRIGGQILEI